MDKVWSHFQNLYFQSLSNFLLLLLVYFSAVGVGPGNHVQHNLLGRDANHRGGRAIFPPGYHLDWVGDHLRRQHKVLPRRCLPRQRKRRSIATVSQVQAPRSGRQDYPAQEGHCWATCGDGRLTGLKLILLVAGCWSGRAAFLLAFHIPVYILEVYICFGTAVLLWCRRERSLTSFTASSVDRSSRFFCFCLFSSLFAAVGSGASLVGSTTRKEGCSYKIKSWFSWLFLSFFFQPCSQLEFVRSLIITCCWHFLKGWPFSIFTESIATVFSKRWRSLLDQQITQVAFCEHETWLLVAYGVGFGWVFLWRG